MSTGVVELGCVQKTHKESGIVYWTAVTVGSAGKGVPVPCNPYTPGSESDGNGDEINVSRIDERYGGAVHEKFRCKTLTISREAYTKVCRQPTWDKIKQLVQHDPKNKVFSTTLLIFLGTCPRPKHAPKLL